jgi:hypothetical protein
MKSANPTVDVTREGVQAVVRVLALHVSLRPFRKILHNSRARAPAQLLDALDPALDLQVGLPVVVAQDEFKRHILKPGFIFEGEALKPDAVKLWVNRFRRAPPHPVEVLRLYVAHGVLERRRQEHDVAWERLVAHHAHDVAAHHLAPGAYIRSI